MQALLFGQAPGQSSLIEVRMATLNNVIEFLDMTASIVCQKAIYFIAVLSQGFTAGGFIYIAIAGVLAEMNSGSSTLKTTAIQLVSLTMGMAVALCISLVE